MHRPSQGFLDELFMHKALSACDGSSVVAVCVGSTLHTRPMVQSAGRPRKGKGLPYGNINAFHFLSLSAKIKHFPVSLEALDGCWPLCRSSTLAPESRNTCSYWFIGLLSATCAMCTETLLLISSHRWKLLLRPAEPRDVMKCAFSGDGI